MKKRISPRIISGKLKGRRLKSVPGTITRPITDRVKENLFNIIGADISGSLFLDAFAGTGSVGIEAYSRGASFIQFIEKNQVPYLVLSENTNLISDTSAFDVYKGDAIRYLKKNASHQFDYCYLAPPQYKGIWKEAALALDMNSNLSSTNGWMIIQIDPTEFEPLDLINFTQFDQRKYGSTQLLFLQKNPK